MAAEKTYIGKGKKNEKFDIVNVSIEMEVAEKFISEYKGKKYLNFEIALMKEPDKFGRTHTCYISERTSKENEPQ